MGANIKGVIVQCPEILHKSGRGRCIGQSKQADDADSVWFVTLRSSYAH